jgi:hypothetical protein
LLRVERKPHLFQKKIKEKLRKRTGHNPSPHRKPAAATTGAASIAWKVRKRRNGAKKMTFRAIYPLCRVIFLMRNAAFLYGFVPFLMRNVAFLYCFVAALMSDAASGTALPHCS